MSTTADQLKENLEGQQVSWNWGGGQPSGTAEQINAGETEITSKNGNPIKKNGDEEDPAVIIKQDGKNPVVKKAHELNETEEATNKQSQTKKDDSATKDSAAEDKDEEEDVSPKTGDKRTKDQAEEEEAVDKEGNAEKGESNPNIDKEEEEEEEEEEEAGDHKNGSTAQDDKASAPKKGGRKTKAQKNTEEVEDEAAEDDAEIAAQGEKEPEPPAKKVKTSSGRPSRAAASGQKDYAE